MPAMPRWRLPCFPNSVLPPDILTGDQIDDVMEIFGENAIEVVDAFQKANNVTINVSNESYDDIQPKASVAANTGSASLANRT